MYLSYEKVEIACVEKLIDILDEQKIPKLDKDGCLKLTKLN